MIKIEPPSREELQELRKTKTRKEIENIYHVSSALLDKWLRGYGLTKKRERVISDEQYEIARRNGINSRTVYHRVYKYNWSIDEAITVPMFNNDKKCKGRKMNEVMA